MRYKPAYRKSGSTTPWVLSVVLTFQAMMAISLSDIYRGSALTWLLDLACNVCLAVFGAKRRICITVLKDIKRHFVYIIYTLMFGPCLDTLKGNFDGVSQPIVEIMISFENDRSEATAMTSKGNYEQSSHHPTVLCYVMLCRWMVSGVPVEQCRCRYPKGFEPRNTLLLVFIHY